MSEIKQFLQGLKTQYRQLTEIRETLRPVWKELADNFIPLKRQVLEENTTTDQVYQAFGDANDEIYDSTPIISADVATSGMQSQITSPAQKWFQLGHPNPEVEKEPEVKTWLEDAQNVMYDVMSRSNFYNGTHEIYKEILLFGTVVFLIEEDFENVIRCSVFTVGEFVLAADSRQRRTTFFREFLMTAEQLVERFGEQNVSASVNVAAKQEDSKYSKFSVIHAIYPNKNRIFGKIDRLNKPFISVYFEKDAIIKVLSVGGFDVKPFMAPRWGVIGNSVYGVSPAMNLLPFAKQLQEETLALIEAIQLEVQPPLNVPPNMKRVNLTPGALNKKIGVEGATPTIEVRANIAPASALIQDVRAQIREGLFNDLFKALALSPKAAMTATEVRERVVEGLRLLGPVLERLQHEFLEPIIDRIFDICLRRGLFPEIPEQLEGTALNIDYVSPLAQAQKAAGLASINQFIGFVGAMAQYDPTVIDTVNFEEIVRTYADISGVPPKTLNSEEEVARKSEARELARQQAMREKIEKDTAENLRTLSQTQVGGGNALEAATEGAA